MRRRAAACASARPWSTARRRSDRTSAITTRGTGAGRGAAIVVRCSNACVRLVEVRGDAHQVVGLEQIARLLLLARLGRAAVEDHGRRAPVRERTAIARGALAQEQVPVA